MKYGIKIMPREVILDTQGRVVQNYLETQGFKIGNCRIGKFIEIHLNSDLDSKNEIQKMMLAGLYNPLIETYEIFDV